MYRVDAIKALCLLLIVPYGIETNTFTVDIFYDYSLLIVPYGIETLVQELCPILDI